MRRSAPWMKNARKSSADIHSIRRQISRLCGAARSGSAGLSQSNEKRKAMIHHIYLPVSDLERSSEFYKKMLEPLGIDMPYKFDQLHGFAINSNPVFWLKNGEVAKDLYVAFT